MPSPPFDPGVCCRWFSAIALWRLGYPDQGLKHARDAVNLARNLSHSLSIALALFHAGWTHYNRGERRDAAEHARAAVEIATDLEFPVVRNLAASLLGRLIVVEGHDEEGIAQISDSLAALSKRRGGGGRRAFLISLLVETRKERRQIEDGLELLANELGRGEHRGYEAELLRLKGELLLERSVPAEQDAQRCFREAIELSRRQQAKSFQLRAVMSLSRLLHEQGKSDEARHMLAEVYGWFTEGFDTADLKEAKALFEELS